MDIYVMNTNFKVVGIIDTYASLIWTDRLRGYGDFEIYTPFDMSILQLCRQNYYLNIDYSDRTMIIEAIEILTDAETGNNLRITGRSLESILDRRIVWNKTIVGNEQSGTEGYMWKAVKKLINEAFITADYQPSGTQRYPRRISNFVYQDLLPGDPLADLKINKTQYTGDNIYDIMVEFCEAFQADGLGFRILLNDSHQFVFSLYSGVDRSYTQNILPYIIFSPEYDNVVNTNYIDDIGPWKNVTLVLGEGEDEERTRIIVGTTSGLNRRELLTDARDLRKEDYDGSTTKYKDALKVRGLERLVENCRAISYEGEVEARRQFVYGRDFQIGDIIQIENEYGIKGNARVIEWVVSDSESGFETYPTFDAIQLIDDTVEEES